MLEHDEHFPKTDWGLVKTAGQPEDDSARLDALGKIVSRYLPALKKHLTIQFRLGAPDADDLLQGFLVNKVLQRDFLASADQERGKFRAFLLRSINNFVLNEFRRAHAAKRSPSGQLLPLDELVGEDEPRSGETADDLFGLEFVRVTIDETLRRMKLECEQSNRTDVWKVFEGRILGGILDDFIVFTYEELVRELGLKSDAEAYKLLHRAKYRFEQIFWQVVAEYAKDLRAVAPEIEELKTILSKSRTTRTKGGASPPSRN